jgi:hypothetical protein
MNRSTGLVLGLVAVAEIAVGAVVLTGHAATAAPAPQILRVATGPGPAAPLVKAPSPCTVGSPRQDCISQAEARRQVEAAGWDWDEFVARTSLRPRYEQIFLDLAVQLSH